MTDARRTTAVALPGDPTGWRATVRDLLRFLRSESPARDDAVRWLHEEAGAADPETADEQLAFLQTAGIVDDDGGAGPGPHGREFLDTHDEAVLYEALTEAVAGFEPLLEALAVRPLTDVEFRDLLEREFDADLGSTDPVLGHRRWLQALGYLEHDDGVNDLTRAGRLRVETDDDLTPPRANRSGAATGADVADSADEDDAGDETATGDSTDEVDHESAAADEDSADPELGTATAAPDDEFAALKRRYDHTCAVCGDRRRRARDEGYARVYHPMPTDEAHGGPAEPENAVVLCPNHHADMAHGMLRVDPRSLEIDHAYEDAVSGRTLATADGHRPGAQYLAYHGSVVADF